MAILPSPSSPIWITHSARDVRTNLLEKYVHEWDKEEREDNESEQSLSLFLHEKRGGKPRENWEQAVVGVKVEEIWRGVLKSSPGFPFLSPKGDCSWYTTRTLYLYPFPHRRISISFVISRARDTVLRSFPRICFNFPPFLPHFVFTSLPPRRDNFYVQVLWINYFFCFFFLSS